MKAINIASLILLAIVLPKSSYSQIARNNFTGVTWKVNEYYLNHVRYQHPTIDSLRYHFYQNGSVELNKDQRSGKATLSYTFNASDSVIVISNSTSKKGYLKIKYADGRNFIYTMSNKDETTGELLLSEFRMVPE